MSHEILNSLRAWNNSTSERQKLQHCYLVIIICVIVISGMISMISAKYAHKLAAIALTTIGIFLANAVIWNLLNSAVLMKLNIPAKQTKK